MQHVEVEQISEAVRTVWSTTLGLEVTPTEKAADRPGSLTGSVGISGKWQGAITMSVPVELARQAAASMFMTEASETSNEEMWDALGELVNQIAGIVRPLISDCCVLSLPTVASGDDAHLTVLGAEPLVEVALACGGDPVLISLLQKREA
jgi:CheY-specific phosphatase CheX